MTDDDTRSRLGDIASGTPTLYCNECENRIDEEELFTEIEVGWYLMPDHATTVMHDAPSPPNIPEDAHRVWSQTETVDKRRDGPTKVKFTVYFHFPKDQTND